MLPDTKITIKPGGEAIIDGQEKSPQCYKLTETANEAGKIISKKKKDHPPVHQTIHTKGA